MVFKLKEGKHKQYSDDKWYDLFSGGYIKPEELLDSNEDVCKVKYAIKILENFMDTCVTSYEDEVE